MPVLFALQNRLDSTEASQRVFFRQHVSGKMKEEECNGSSGKGRKSEVAYFFFCKNVSIEALKMKADNDTNGK